MKVKLCSLLLTTATLIGLYSASTTSAAETGTKEIVNNTRSDEIGRRVALFDGPNGHTCTATMLTPNFGLTAAHCGNGIKEDGAGKVSPAQSALQTPFGSMGISLFNPYVTKDIAFIYGKNSDKDTSYKYYEKEFAKTEIKLDGFTKEQLEAMNGKKVYSFGYPYDYDGYKQYKFTGEITHADDNSIRTTLPSAGGQSGSALFLKDTNELIGVLVAGGGDINSGNGSIYQPITKEISSWYKTKKDLIENPPGN
ncbi:trypsin-like serine protease [Staphylococcus sp. 11007852]|uniref:trypsin-like serine peptidase n=1 Tax=Staphylococcus sp. 11007852 TaxID=2714543 RepID=UPI00140329DE|nr:trypsin-like serine protease [Staphylococcus sp. 11007852]NHM75851.1 trypsin-like serine protease [Staphylococcus sp. 11007852]